MPRPVRQILCRNRTLCCGNCYATASREQIAAGLCETDEGPAFVHSQPATFDGELEARRILYRCRLITKQKRAVGLFNVDASVLRVRYGLIYRSGPEAG